MADRWLTFDCFGTLIDWRHGIATTGELLFPGRGPAFLDAYSSLESEVESETPFRPYREVLAETTRRAASNLSLELNPNDAPALASTIPFWRPFFDLAALEDLRSQGWKLALLTNCDRDLIAQTRLRLPVPFDDAVTAEDVSAYKPDHAHFRRFQAAHGGDAQEWIHVAQSHFHDVRPARDLGIKRIWVNRHKENDDPSLADAVIFGLAELPRAVAALSDGG